MRRTPHELLPFLAIYAVNYAREYELDGIHSTHFDLMEKYGARMKDFKRATNDGVADVGRPSSGGGETAVTPVSGDPVACVPDTYASRGILNTVRRVRLPQVSGRVGYRSG